MSPTVDELEAELNRLKSEDALDAIVKTSQAFTDLATVLNAVGQPTEVIELVEALSSVKTESSDLSIELKKAGDNSDALKETSESMKDSKFKTAVKELGSTLKGMAGAQLAEQLGLWQGINDIMAAFLSPLSLISPLFSVVAAIVQEAMTPALQMLAPLIVQASTFLMENKGAIQAVIQVLSPFTYILGAITGDWSSLYNALEVFTPVIDAVKGGWEALGTSIETIHDSIEDVGDLIGDWFTDKIDDAYDALHHLGDMFDDFIDWCEEAADAITFWD